MHRLKQYCMSLVLAALSLSLVSCPTGGGGGNEETFDFFFLNIPSSSTFVESIELINQQTGQLENVLDVSNLSPKFERLVLPVNKFATGFDTVRISGRFEGSPSPLPLHDFSIQKQGFRAGPGPLGIALTDFGTRGNLEPAVSTFEITDARDAKGADTFNLYLFNLTGISVSTVEVTNHQTGDLDSVLPAPIPPFTLLIQPLSTADYAGSGATIEFTMESGDSLTTPGGSSFGQAPSSVAVFDSAEGAEITPQIRNVLLDDSVE